MTLNWAQGAAGKVHLAEANDDGVQKFDDWRFSTLDRLALRHRGKSNILFLDAHVKTFAPPILPISNALDSWRIQLWLHPRTPVIPEL